MIESIYIKNFKKFDRKTIKIEQHNIFIGENTEEYKENQSSAEISDPVKDKIGMLRNILQDNVSKEKGVVKPKRSDADKKVIREAITEYLER